MKAKFEEPTIEVVRFSSEDVDVVTSSGSGAYSWRDPTTVSDK